MTTRAEVKLLDAATLRVASWPIELLYGFEAPKLTALIRLVEEAECDVRETSLDLTEALYEVIPAIMHRPMRLLALELKRGLYRTLEPFDALDDVIRTNPAELSGLSVVLSFQYEKRQRLKQLREALHEAFMSEMARGSSHLKDIVLEPRFRKALILGHSKLEESFSRVFIEERGPLKAKRSLERTLFRHLMRAIGRPTPSGVWAGVTSVEFDTTLAQDFQIAPSSCKYRATVDLQPFLHATKALTKLRRYRLQSFLSLNPTAIRHTDGRISWVSMNRSTASPMELLDRPFLRAFFEYFGAQTRRSATPLLNAVTNEYPDDRMLGERLVRLVDRLIDMDLLRVNLSILPRYDTVWHALDDIVSVLLEPERSVWGTSIREMRRLCRILEKSFDELSSEQLRSLRVQIDKLVTRVLLAANVPLDADVEVLHVDMLAPFKVVIGHGFVQSLTYAVSEYLSFHRSLGAAELFRNATARYLHRVTRGEEILKDAVHNFVMSGGLSESEEYDEQNTTPASFLTIAEFFNRLALDAETARHLRDIELKWRGCIEASLNTRTMTLELPLLTAEYEALPPIGGSLVLELWGNRRIGIGIGRPHVNVFNARFADLLRSVDDDSCTRVTREWLACAAVGTRRFVEVVSDDIMNPNAGIHTPLVSKVFDTRCLEGCALDSLRIEWDKIGSSPKLAEIGSDCSVLLTPIYISTAAICDREPVSSILFRLAMSQGWEYLLCPLPFGPHRVEMRCHAPQMLLPGGACITGERWIVDVNDVNQLLSAKGVERFLIWRRLANSMGLTRFIFVQYSSWANPVLIPRDSPFAVESVIGHFPSPISPLFVSECPIDVERLPIVDDRGQHYLAQLAISWVPESCT